MGLPTEEDDPASLSMEEEGSANLSDDGTSEEEGTSKEEGTPEEEEDDSGISQLSPYEKWIEGNQRKLQKRRKILW